MPLDLSCYSKNGIIGLLRKCPCDHLLTKHILNIIKHFSEFYIKDYVKGTIKDWCLQCFDTVGWAAGRAPGL